jgi:regulatory protein
LRTRALRLLARREHSRREMERKLAAPDRDPAQVAAVLDELEARGWLSEQRLAEQAIAAAHGRYGPGRVLHALRAKGVSEAVLEQTAAILKAQELDEARALWQKRFGRPAQNLRETARQARFLEGRGFSAAIVRSVLRADPGD